MAAAAWLLLLLAVVQPPTAHSAECKKPCFNETVRRIACSLQSSAWPSLACNDAQQISALEDNARLQ
jgi:hypothetical protein